MSTIRNTYSTRIVIDMETLEILEKDSIEYSGPWELAEGEGAPPIGGGAPADGGSPADSGDLPGGDAGDVGDGTPAPEPVEGEPIEGQEPVEGEPIEGEPVDGEPQAAKPPTPQELASDATLKKAYRENFGTIKEVIKQHPELRAPFFKAAELNELFTTVEDGKQAKEWANQLYNFDNLYYSRNPEDKKAFLQSLYENSLEQDGSSPHYDQIASMVVGDGLNNLATRIQQGDQAISRAFSDLGLNGKQAAVAVQAVAAMLGIPLSGVRFSSHSNGQPSPGNLSEREQYLANEVARLNSEIEANRNANLATSEKSFYNGIQTTFHTNLANSIEKALVNATALKTQKPGFQSWVKDQISQRVISTVRSDQFFANQMESMSRAGNRDPEHQQRLVAALEQRARQFLPDIVNEVLADAGITIMQKTNGKGNQAGTQHREPATSGTPGRLTKPSAPGSKPQKGESYEQYSRRLLEMN